MKNNVPGWVLFALTCPLVLGWVWLLIMCVFRRVEWSSLRFQGAGVLVGRKTKKADTGFSTTIGRAMAMSRREYDDTKAFDGPIERHEVVHIKQYEDDVLTALLVGLVAGAADNNWGLGFGIYVSGVAWMLPNYVTAVMRYGWKGAYRDTEHERSAYAQTDMVRALGGEHTSWDEMRDEARKKQEGLLG
jgi:hypothetical protein